MSHETSHFAKFHYNIKSYDFHTYFHLNDKEETKFAIIGFRENVIEEFKDDIAHKKIGNYKIWHEQVGPHPSGYGMFEFDVRDSNSFLKLLNFYQLNHGQLSVLIHPKTNQGDLFDHTQGALWLGPQLDLNLDTLMS